MLTSELVKPRLRRQGRELTIDLVDEQEPHWQQLAQELITLFQQQLGQPLSVWEQVLEGYAGERLDYIVLRGLAKVLTDDATFTPLTTPLPPAQLRERIFAHGPVFSTPQLFQQQGREDVLHQVAEQLAVSSEQIEQALFADRLSAYLLTESGRAWSPQELLARYNLELARGVLYWASHVQIQVYDNYKDLWKFLKLFKLMFEARPHDGGYLIELDGPISPFVSATTRYGRQFAAFLPALLLGQRWNMVATVRSPLTGSMTSYRLDQSTMLRSHFAQSGAFDSRLEADFAREFAEKFGDARGQWLLTREDEVLLLGDTVMIPDFAFTNKKHGHRILLELVGFWHPDYLRRKVEKVRAAQRQDLLLLVYEGVNLSAETLRDVPGEVLYFKNKPVLKDVLGTVESMARRIYAI